MIDNLKLNEIESNNGQVYLNNLIWKQFKINFGAIKSLDDIIIILKASNLSLHFIPGQNTITEIEINNNKHLFKEIVNEYKTN